MMMKEISLHVLDIMQNSIAAGATLIVVEVEVQHAKDWMRVAVEDNGCGMDEAMAQRVMSPFTTSRTTRKVGLGIPCLLYTSSWRKFIVPPIKHAFYMIFPLYRKKGALSLIHISCGRW